MMKNNLLAESLEGVCTVALSGHIRPDGDCMGSCMGLYHFLKENYPDVHVDVYLEEFLSVYNFIEDTELVRHEVPDHKKYDLFISLDCGDAARLGFAEELFHCASRTLCIDHHISNEAFAGKNYIDPDASSTSELVCRLTKGGKITKAMAECLYMGIVHDTGVFQYSCTSPETMETAAELMRCGINGSWIIDKTFYEKSFLQNQILGKALLDSRLILDGKGIVSVIEQKDMVFYGVTPKELDGIVSQLRNTRGVEVAIFLYELEDGDYKISLRANGQMDVSRIASHFGGGGHVKASGANMKGNARDIIDRLTEQILLQLPG